MKKIVVGLSILVVGLGVAGGYYYNTSSKKIDQLQDAVKTATERASTAEERAVAAINRGDSLEGELAQIKRDQVESTSQLSALRSSLANATEQLVAAKGQVSAKESELVEAKARLIQTSGQVSELQSSLANATTRGDRATQKADALGALLTKVSRLETSLAGDLSNARQAVKDAETVLANDPSKQNFASLKQSYEKLLASCSRVEPLAKAVADHIEAQGDSLSDATSAIVVVSQKVKSARTSIEATRTATADCQKWAAEKSIGIYANQGWQSSELEVETGCVVAVAASGHWEFAPFTKTGSGPLGVNANSAWRVKADAPNGTILARVHGSEQMSVAIPACVANRNGKIEFRINDDVIGDNSGTMDVTAWCFRPLQ